MKTGLIAGTGLIASAAAALLAAAPADGQQRVVARGPGMGMTGGGMRPPMAPGAGMPGRPPMVHPGQPRWGSKVNGRWWGGANAPGGWNAYHRPSRGWTLPSYWVAPRFYVNDWQTYGLYQPSYGYNWVRYYDDAVLVDGRGGVYDSRDGVDWDRYDDGYYTDDEQVYAAPAERRYAPGASYAGPGYAQPAYDGGSYRRRSNDGIGGAVVGGVVGGVAGNLIAGRGNRLGGTLIGAGVGALVGQQVDKSVTADARARRGATYAAPGRGGYDRGGYDVPVAPDYAPGPVYAPPAPVVQPLPPRGHGYPPPPGYGGQHWVSPDGGTTVTTSSAGGYYGGSTTTVTVQTAPVVTTTTTEIYEDEVTYVKRARPRPVKTKRVWRPRPVCRCY